MTTTDPFGMPGPPSGDPFGTPGRPRGDYDDAEARAAQNLPIDQWGRYRIPSPDGIQPAVNKGRTRVSTTKGVGQDQTRLQARTERLIVKGLAADPTLVERATAALKLEDDSKAQRKALTAVASAAFIAAGGDDRKDQGTEVHQIIDDILKGNNPEVPEKYQRDVSAYFEALEKFGLEPVPGLSELVVLAPFEHGGAIDNIMRWWNPDTEMYELVVVDTKTGATLEYSRVEFLSQTWFYSNALYSFTVTGMDRDKDGKLTTVRGYTEDLPLELRRDKAIIIHLPMDGTAEVVLLDLSGWDRIVAAQIAIRQANAEAKYRYRSLGVIRPEAFIAPASNWAERGRITMAQDSSQPSALTQALDETIQGPQARAQQVADQIIDSMTIETSSRTPQELAGHLAGTVRHTEHLGQPGTTPIDMSRGEFNPVETAVQNHAANDGRDPVTGRKKRTCGFCHRPGHTQKNCPDNPASEKYTGGVTGPARALGGASNDAVEHAHTEGPEDCTHRLPQCCSVCHVNEPQSVEHLSSEESAQLIEAAAAQVVNPRLEPEAQPFCTLVHAHTWTSQHPAAPGQWVCSVSGKPGRAAYETGRTAVTGEAPFYGAPQDAGNAPADSFSIETLNAVKPLPAVFTETAARHAAEQAAWPPPSLLDLIAQAPTQAAVLQLRQQHLSTGTWTPEHDAAGMARYQLLAPGEPS